MSRPLRSAVVDQTPIVMSLEITTNEYKTIELGQNLAIDPEYDDFRCHG
jgi:hypothetical protein